MVKKRSVLLDKFPAQLISIAELLIQNREQTQEKPAFRRGPRHETTVSHTQTRGHSELLSRKSLVILQRVSDEIRPKTEDTHVGSGENRTRVHHQNKVLTSREEILVLGDRLLQGG